MSVATERSPLPVREARVPLVPVKVSTPLPMGGDTFQTSRVNAAIRALLGDSREITQVNWLRAVARLVVDMRPDIGSTLVTHLGVTALDGESPVGHMSIGEIGVVYEALMALSDRERRKSQGQFFTPDDVASFMADQARRFPLGAWLDPCCGVGNLAWHLANAMDDPGEFVATRLTLVDLDEVALKTAQVLLVASFADPDDRSALLRLVSRSEHRSFLDPAPLPSHDFVIVNPPYAAAARDGRFRSAAARDLYAYFLERVADESQGFVAITPASYLSAPKYAQLRQVLSERPGGDVLVFDNVPDTCFRGFKYGSTNSSKTNFVRAAITVSAPADREWKVTPILRWAARSRRNLWLTAREFLVPRRTGPSGEWAKVMPGTEGVWDALATASETLGTLVTSTPTPFRLEIASTPRYYVSASKRPLQRTSKHTLYFPSEHTMDKAYILLNSSLPYWWWRCLDGGITLPIRTLLTLPVPSAMEVNAELVRLLERSEEDHVVTKLNAGKHNENIKRPRELVDEIDSAILPGVTYSFDQVYASDMFAGRRLGVIEGG